MNETAQSWALKMTAPLEPGIVCNDIEQMLKFYVGILGLTLVSDADTTPEMSRRLGGTPHGYRIVRLQTPYGERIKLVQPARQPPKPNPVPEWLYERHGLAYLTFVIQGISGVAKHLKEQGAKLISPEPTEVRKGVFALYFSGSGR